jgi:acetyl-CoA/propionyl-CoA carboxylase biotin carboxyl carrier protein
MRFSKVLIANRGEIAVRVARTCHELGIAVVGLYSDPDEEALHVKVADEAVHLPGEAPTDTYLNLPAIVEAARSTGADAIHPGYGFLSERGDAARAVRESGVAWIGPPPEAIEAAGDKVRARQLAVSAGVPVVPGTLVPVRDASEVRRFGERHGYPVAIKATGGGGGRGFRVATSPDETEAALAATAREARAYFGSPVVYLERYLARPKHIEIQVLAPARGETLWLGARDCSLQRRHQKLVEETPPPRHSDVVAAMGRAAVAVANACGYVNAGTVEFLVDENGSFYFLEVNARLQVEHTITEEVTGLDLVACQLRIAAGDPLGFGQDDVRARGHAIECRINAEDPARGFLPRPGVLVRYAEPTGPGVRVDSGFTGGDRIPHLYDSLIAKLVTVGSDREEARRRMLHALDGFRIEGVPTTIAAHRLLMEHPAFVDGSYTTRTVEDGALDALATAGPEPDTIPGPRDDAVLLVKGTPVRLWNPAIAASVSAASRTGAGVPGTVVAPMHGTILKLLVAEGDEVRTGDGIALLEAMKMETFIAAGASGIVKEIRVAQGETVEAGETVAVLG